MANREVKIRFGTTYQGGGAERAKRDLKGVQEAAAGVVRTADEMERELRQAQAALGRADVGSAAFRKLQVQIAKTKESLRDLKTGNVDAKGLERVTRQFETLRTRTEAARREAGKMRESFDRGPRAEWVGKLSGEMEKLTSRLPGGARAHAFFSGLTKGAGAAAVAVGTVTAALLSYIGLVKAGIPRVAIVEDLEASFETLLGSTDRAIGRVQEMRTIAAETPLTIAGLASTSRTLETLTDGAMGAAASIKLVGDAAAVATRPGESLDATIQNVALHVGRLQASLSTGKGEIGESTLRLQELGLISGQTAFQLRELHKEGGRGVEAWEMLERALGRFEGEMERRSQTINGRLSTLGDAWGMLTAEFAKPWADPFRSGVQIAITALDGLRKTLEVVHGAFGITSRSAASSLGEIETTAMGVAAELDNARDSAEEMGKAATAAVDALGESYDRTADKASKAVDRARELNKLNLQLELQRIEADPNLDDVGKARAKGRAREAAGQEDLQLQIRDLERQAEVRQREIDALRKAANESEERANRLANERQSVAGEAAGASRLDEVINKRLEESREIERTRNDLEKVISGIQGGGLSGTVATAIREGLNVLDPGNLLKAIGDVAGFEVNDYKSTAELGTVLNELNAELKRRGDETNKLLEKRQGLGDPNELGQRLSGLTAQLEAAEARAEKFAAEAAKAAEALEKTTPAREAEIEHLRKKGELETQIIRGQSSSEEEKERQRAAAERGKEKAAFEKNLERSSEDTRGDMLDTLKAILELSPEHKGIEGAVFKAEQGDFSDVDKVAGLALGSSNEKAQRLGEVLTNQADELRGLLDTLAASQRITLDGIRDVALQMAAMNAGLTSAFSEIAILRGQIKNNRK